MMPIAMVSRPGPRAMSSSLPAAGRRSRISSMPATGCRARIRTHPGINQALRDDGRINFVSDVAQSGPGWGCHLDLPYGVTATNILARREELASGLRRPLSATWPEKVPAEHAGRLELWIGFHDISKAKSPVWPLARAGQCDVFEPFPFGTDPRGRKTEAPLFEHNWLIEIGRAHV